MIVSMMILMIIFDASVDSLIKTGSTPLVIVLSYKYPVHQYHVLWGKYPTP